MIFVDGPVGDNTGPGVFDHIPSFAIQEMIIMVRESRSRQKKFMAVPLSRGGGKGRAIKEKITSFFLNSDGEVPTAINLERGGG